MLHLHNRDEEILNSLKLLPGSEQGAFEMPDLPPSDEG
jgi:hypothetical protein